MVRGLVSMLGKEIKLELDLSGGWCMCGQYVEGGDNFKDSGCSLGFVASCPKCGKRHSPTLKKEEESFVVMRVKRPIPKKEVRA